MDALLLSRIQFGISLGLHYIYPITTLGLTFFILLSESLYLAGKNNIYRDIVQFLVKLLGITFTMGVATGIILPFSFGANWGRFSVFAGGIIGSQLAVESVTAFALESVFLAILIFGRKKVPGAIYWLSALMVFIGAHLSAFWIVSANSWMQTPDGYSLENGRIIMTDFGRMIFNPSTLIRFIHVTSAAWLTGSVLLAGISAFYLLKKRHVVISKTILGMVLVPFIVTSISQAVLGHTHIMEVRQWEPVKDAAYEGIFVTTNGAPLYAFGVPDAKNRKIHFAFGVPYMLSFLETGDLNGKVDGLDKFPESDWPPVNVIFTTFHLMVMIGILLIVVSLGAGLFYARKTLFGKKWFLLVLAVIIPLPYLSNELGWAGTEIGRQPWIITGLLKTTNASTTIVPASSVLATLVLIFSVFSALLALYVYSVLRILKKGPETNGK